MTLVEFLLARIAEDEATANLCMGKHWRSRLWNGYDQVVDVDEDPEDCLVCVFPDLDMERDHVARWDPARVLAECEAKRHIVELPDPNSAGSFVDGWWEAHSAILELLALPVRIHPDYDESWRP